MKKMYKCTLCETTVTKRTTRWCRPCFAKVRTGKKREGFVPWSKGKTLSLEHKMKLSLAAKAQRKTLKGIEHMKKITSIAQKSNIGRVNSQESLEKTRLKVIGTRRPSISGPNHYLWIADRTKLAKKQERNDSAYREWRKSVRNRDGWQCKMANGDCSGKVVAHHILPWSKFPELRYEINNGITLCRFHHPRKRADEAKLSPYFQSMVMSNSN